MTTHTTATNSTDTRSPALFGAVAALVGITLSTLGAHDWTEIAIEVVLIGASSALVFGVVVPRALRKESAGGTALGLSIPAALLVVPAFWSGLPLVLGVAGMVVGNAGRSARTGAGTCIAALVLGALTVIAYAFIYVGDLGSGGLGFLFD
jgi:hypothetical protein